MSNTQTFSFFFTHFSFQKQTYFQCQDQHVLDEWWFCCSNRGSSYKQQQMHIQISISKSKMWLVQQIYLCNNEHTPTSAVLNKNCLLRLLFSIVSISVIVKWPLGPVPKPIMDQFLSISQPMAPAPTKNSLVLAIFSWNSRPKTAIWPSYREPV